MISRPVRWQFSLTTLMLLFVASSIWLGVETSRLRRKARAIEMLEQLGAGIVYDYQWSNDGAWLPNAKPPGSPWLQQAFGVKYSAEVVEIELFCGFRLSQSAQRIPMLPEQFGDEQARLLSAHTGIRWLVLMDTSMTDAGLRHLGRIKRLERLDLEGTPVTEAGIRDLHRALPQAAIYYDNGYVAPQPNESTAVAE